jgi:hypothetical protein
MIDNNREVAPSQTAGLQIRLIKRTYVLPWSQFLFAEGGEDEIRMAFSTHDVIVTGGRLDMLLPDVAAQRVTLLREPLRSDIFAAESGLRITGIAVKKVE